MGASTSALWIKITQNLFDWFSAINLVKHSYHYAISTTRARAHSERTSNFHDFVIHSVVDMHYEWPEAFQTLTTTTITF